MLKKGAVIITQRARILESRWSHALGLMFRKKLDDESYIFVFKNPKRDYVTMMFMRFPIDIIWLDEDKKILDIYEEARPYQRLIPFKHKSKYMVECAAGTVRKHSLKIGEKLSFP